ncbi:hypothetical protein N9H77_01245 [Porticoccaceae bacterium]|nr:hypothetical protein [Porticoccaceae bacterium]
MSRRRISATIGSEQRIIVDQFRLDPTNFTLGSLSDTTISTPADGNFLSYASNKWVNVDATTARTNLGLGSLATLNSLAFADLTDKPTTITGYGITDAVTSVDGSTGAVTTLQLGTSSVDALRGDTVIPDVSNFITATSNETLTNKSIDATQLTGTIDNDRLPSAATNITSVGSLTGLTIDSLGTLAVPIPTVVTFDNQFSTNTFDVKSSASEGTGNQKATIKVSARSRAAVEFRSRNFGNANYDLFFGHVASAGGETQDYALLRAPTSRFVIKSDDDIVELNGTKVLLNTPTVEFEGSGYSSDLISSIKPDNTNSSSSWLDTGKQFDVDAQEAQINGVWLGDSGTKMYVIGAASDDLHQYALSTAYDVSTATFTQTNTSGFGGNPQSLWFNNGSDPITIDAVVHNTGQLLVTVDGGSDQLRSYKLSTAWDISTRSASAVTVRDFTTNVDTNPTGIAFSNDGSKIILCGSGSKVANENDIIYSYNLSSPYDIDTISTSTSGGTNANAPDAKVNLADFSDFIVPVGLPSDIQFSADGTTLYLVCKDRDDVITFTLGTAFDITTMTYNGHLGQFWDEGNLSSIWVDYDNNIALIGGQTNDKVRQYTVDNDALIVDAKNTRFKGSINSHSHGNFEGHMFISGKIVGRSSANFANITSGGNINFTVGGTGTVKIGGTNQTGEIDIGRTNKTHTLKLASGPTHGILNAGDADEVPAQTKTVEIGMGGLAGSTTNTTIGNPTVGQTNTVTINHSPGVTWTSGSGAPTHSASPGSLYTNTGGGSGTTLYVKESGTDGNGWVGK